MTKWVRLSQQSRAAGGSSHLISWICKSLRLLTLHSRSVGIGPPSAKGKQHVNVELHIRKVSSESNRQVCVPAESAGGGDPSEAQGPKKTFLHSQIPHSVSFHPKHRFALFRSRMGNLGSCPFIGAVLVAHNWCKQCHFDKKNIIHLLVLSNSGEDTASPWVSLPYSTYQWCKSGSKPWGWRQQRCPESPWAICEARGSARC